MKMSRKSILLLVVSLILFFSSNGQASTDSAGNDLYVMRIHTQILKNLKANDFSQANTLLAKEFTQKKLSVHGKRTLEEIYNLLQSFEDIGVLDKWCKTTPESHFPFAVRGIYEIGKAWPMTGAKSADKYPPGDYDKYLQASKRAQADLEKAYFLNPDDPVSSTGMVALSTMRGYPKMEMEKWFKRAVTADNLWFLVYRYKLQYLFPYNFGSFKAMEQFVQDTWESRQQGSTAHYLVFAYLEAMYPLNQTVHFPGYSMTPHPAVIPQKETQSAIYNAIKLYQKEFPESSVGRYYQGRYKLLFSWPREAFDIFVSILEKEPDNVKVLLDLNRASIKLKEYATAKKYCKKILKIEPDNTWALADLATLNYLTSSDESEGYHLFQQAIANSQSLYEKSLYYYALGFYLDRNGKSVEALKELNNVTRLPDIYDKATLKKGEILHRLGRTDEAIELLITLIAKRSRYSGSAKSLIEQYRSATLTKESESSVETQLNSSPLQEGVVTADIEQTTVSKLQPPLSPQRRNAMLDRCELLYYRGVIAEATDCYSNLLFKTPGSLHGTIYYKLGEIAEKLEYDPQKAAAYYAKAVESNPKHQEYILGMGRVMYMQQQYSNALVIFTKLIEINKAHGRALYYRALCFDALNRIDEAIKDMELAKIYSPEVSVEASAYLQENAARQMPVVKLSKEEELLQLAESSMIHNRYDKAEKLFLELLNMDPGNDYAHFRLGILYLDRDNNHVKAQQQFDKALNVNPGKEDYLLSRAQSLQFTEQYGKAIEDWSTYLELKPYEAYALGSRAKCYVELNQFVLAEKDLKAAIELEPGNSYLKSKLSDLMLKTKGEDSELMEDVDYVIQLGRKQRNRKNLKEAEKLFQKAIELDPDSGVPYYELGVMHFSNSKNYKKAIDYFTKAIDVNGEQRSYLVKRGMAFLFSNKYKAAKADFNVVLTMNENDSQSLYYRAVCNKNLGLKDDAIADYIKVKDLDPAWRESAMREIKKLMKSN